MMNRKVTIALLILVIFFFIAGIFLEFKYLLPTTGKAVNSAGKDVECGNYSLASPSSASASSSHQVETQSGYGKTITTYSASRAIDSSSSTYWQASLSATFPQWIYFNLGGEKCIKGITAILDGSSTSMNVEVQISDDAIDWNSIGSWNIGSSGAQERKDFSEITARYIRLYQSSGGAKGKIADFKADFAQYELVPYCTDSDKGKDYMTKGDSDSYTSNSPLSDECLTSKTLLERYCNDLTLETETFICNGLCSGGRCIGGAYGEAGQTGYGESSVSNQGVIDNTSPNNEQEPIGSGCTPKYECVIYPPSCPSSGEQTKICVDKVCDSEQKEENVKCNAGSCSGCLHNGRCLPYGTKFRDYESGGVDRYCSVDGNLKMQKDPLFLSPSGQELDISCSANYECASNICRDGKCFSVNNVISEAEQNRPRQSLGIRALCRAANLFDEKEYESCLLDYFNG